MVENSQDEYRKVHDKALELLTGRIHTREELKRKLAQKGFQSTLVEEVLHRLAELKVLNDERFAEIFLDNLIRYKTYGYYGLKMKLLQRGLDASLAEKLLQENLPYETEKKIARKIVGKSSKSDGRKLALSLQRKGFRSETIRQILKEF